MPAMDGGSGNVWILGFQWDRADFEMGWEQSDHDGTWAGLAFPSEYQSLNFDVTQPPPSARAAMPSRGRRRPISASSRSLGVRVRASFPGPGGKWQVSTNGGVRPVWRSDGRELFYVSDDRELMSVTVESEEGFRHDTPVSLFEFDGWTAVDGRSTYDVAADGSRFLILGPVENEARRVAVVSLVQGWGGR